MGIRNQPEFETETPAIEETNTMTTATVADSAKASVAATTAIAKAATGTAVATPSKLTLAFKDKQAVFDIETVEGLALSVPRIKGEQGSLFANEADLGDKIRFEIVSISPRWVIGTGTQDKEAKDYFRVSYDNRTISGEDTLVEDYVASLKAQGFNKAKKSDYLDIFGFVVWSAKKGDIPVEERELACLQCSPTSKGAFTAFCTTRGLMESKGVAKPLDLIEVHAEKRASGDNRYTNFSFCAPKV